MDFVHPVAAVIPGAQGRVLAVLADTAAELNLRTLARMSRVSVAQLSRIMPGLVELGLVERREVPPSSQFRLVRAHVAARAVLELAAARNTVIAEMATAAEALTVRPVSVILFGSFARGTGERGSDLDVLVVRPAGVDDDDERWASSIEQWSDVVRALTGNSVEILEVGADEVAARLATGRELWQEIRRDGHVVYGLPLDELAAVCRA